MKSLDSELQISRPVASAGDWLRDPPWTPEPTGAQAPYTKCTEPMHIPPCTLNRLHLQPLIQSDCYANSFPCVANSSVLELSGIFSLNILDLLLVESEDAKLWVWRADYKRRGEGYAMN